jgi:hypothetical protein
MTGSPLSDHPILEKAAFGAFVIVDSFCGLLRYARLWIKYRFSKRGKK